MEFGAEFNYSRKVIIAVNSLLKLLLS
jgi:hypothetical protein